MSARLAYLNGQFVPEAGLALGYADAGVVSGVTVTDFVRTARGGWFLADRHRARFRRDCAALGIPLAATDAELAEVASTLLVRNRPLTPSPELALISIATPGPLAYLTGAECDGPPTLAMHTAPLDPARYAKLSDPGATVILAGAMPGSPHLPAAVKHRSRLHWHLAGRGISLARGEVAALLTPEGYADAAVGSLLAVHGDTIIASPPGRVLASVTVEWLREVAAGLGLGWDEAGADWRELAGARGGFTEAIIAGSGFGVAPVVAVRGDIGEVMLAAGPAVRMLRAAAVAVGL